MSSASHFPLMLYSNVMNPVALPAGRAKLSTKPPPIGSATFTNTIGTLRVACCNGPTSELDQILTLTGNATPPRDPNDDDDCEDEDKDKDEENEDRSDEPAVVRERTKTSRSLRRRSLLKPRCRRRSTSLSLAAGRPAGAYD